MQRTREAWPRSGYGDWGWGRAEHRVSLAGFANGGFLRLLGGPDREDLGKESDEVTLLGLLLVGCRCVSLCYSMLLGSVFTYLAGRHGSRLPFFGGERVERTRQGPFPALPAVGDTIGCRKRSGIGKCLRIEDSCMLGSYISRVAAGFQSRVSDKGEEFAAHIQAGGKSRLAKDSPKLPAAGCERTLPGLLIHNTLEATAWIS